MRIAIMVAAFVGLGCFSTMNSQAAGKAKAIKDQEKTTQEEQKLAKARQDALATMKLAITECGSLYSVEIMALDVAYKRAVAKRRLENASAGRSIDFSNSDRIEIQENILMEKEKEGYSYKQCVATSKATMANGGAKEFVALFKSQQQQKAKEALAQWLTVIDAIGKNNFDQEVSKYDLVINSLNVDAMTN